MIFTLLLTFIAFFLKGIISLDPDFGWYMKSGEIILTSGIPRFDPFSYTMPSFPFIDHEWLANVLLKISYPLIGMPGVVGIYAVLALLAIYIASKLGVRQRFWEFPAVLAIGIIFPFFGPRPQVIGWLFWAVFLGIIFNKPLWNKWKLLIPVLLLAWVNLHGSFAAAIVTLAIVIILRSWQKKKISPDLILVFIAGILATFINPYGQRIWYQVWLTVSNTSLRWQIMEWLPAVFSANPTFIVYFSVSVFLVFKTRKKFGLDELGVYVFFFLQAFTASKQMPFWTILSLPLTIKATNLTLKSFRGIPMATQRFAKVYKWALIGSVCLVFLQILVSFIGLHSFSEANFYPKGALVYLRANVPGGEIFSEYGWGGYLIWKFPEKKVFIDGRMPVWHWKDNPSDESDYIMRDYVDLLNGKIDYKEVFEKYNVEVVLWPKERPPRLLDVLSQRLANLISKQKEPFSLIGELKKDGWQKVYEDEVGVVYKKPI